MSKTDTKKIALMMLALFAISLSSFGGVDLAFAESGSSNDDAPDAEDAPDNDVPEAEEDDAPDTDED